jgi:hypothetical protein
MSNKYVLVTCISTHRMRYAVPVDELQKLNTEIPIEGLEIEWAKDCVAMEEVREFSQEWLGEKVVDASILDEEAILEIFDSDNDYLRSWSKEKKLEHIRNWKEKY